MRKSFDDSHSGKGFDTMLVNYMTEKVEGIDAEVTFLELNKAAMT